MLTHEIDRSPMTRPKRPTTEEAGQCRPMKPCSSQPDGEGQPLELRHEGIDGSRYYLAGQGIHADDIVEMLLDDGGWRMAGRAFRVELSACDQAPPFYQPRGQLGASCDGTFSLAAPDLITDAGEKASRRFIECFTTNRQSY